MKTLNFESKRLGGSHGKRMRILTALPCLIGVVDDIVEHRCHLLQLAFELKCQPEWVQNIGATIELRLLLVGSRCDFNDSG